MFIYPPVPTADHKVPSITPPNLYCKPANGSSPRLPCICSLIQVCTDTACWLAIFNPQTVEHVWTLWRMHGLGSNVFTHAQRHLRTCGTRRAEGGINLMPCCLFTEIKEGAYNQCGLIDGILWYTCPPTILDHCTMTYAVILGWGWTLVTRIAVSSAQ